MGLLCICISVYGMRALFPQRPEECIPFYRTQATDNRELLHGSQQQKSSPLGKDPVFLTTKPSISKAKPSDVL